MFNILNKLIKPVFAISDPNGGFGGNYNSSSQNLPADPTGFINIGSIVTKLLPYVYVAAGLILLLKLISGGISLMTSAGNADKAKAGYGKIIGAFIGFFIIFLSYFAARIVEAVLGVKFM